MKITSWWGNLFMSVQRQAMSSMNTEFGNAREVECEIVGLLTDDQYAKHFEALQKLSNLKK